MGLWFPEIQNRLSMTTAENHETICQIIGDTFQNRNDLINTTKVNIYQTQKFKLDS